MTTLTLIAIGDSTGVILPRELLDRLGVETGDSLYFLDTPNGIELRPCEPEFVRQMDIAGRVMQEDHGVLQKLAD